MAVWALLFAAPLLSLYVRTISGPSVAFNWAEIFIVWRKFAVFLLLFLVHNFLLAPLLVKGHKRTAYISVMIVIVAIFTVYQCSSRPQIPDEPPFHEMGRPEFHGTTEESDCLEQPGPPRFEHDHRPPLIVGEHDIMAVVVLILMFGANLGIKGYYRSRDDRKRMAELERENLEQQLEYLRYQINPHFFMNTLNNIHALVDIDPEQAKATIVELSKMMRFVLYEGNKQGVPLTRELDFILHYVTLMKLRYTEKVKITIDLPLEVPDRQIPPLILITFIENAFKHGISYKQESFVEIIVSVKADKLHFSCRNSRAAVKNEEKGGVGLANVRKRLDLLYADNYTLDIQDAPDVFTVNLVIPL